MSLGTPTLCGSKKEPGSGSVQTSTVDLSSSAPPGSTIFLVMCTAITNHYPAYVTSPGGERWRLVGAWDNNSATRANIGVLSAYLPDGMTAGTTLTIRHAVSANATRLFAVFYVTGRAILDGPVKTSAGALSTWSAPATDAAAVNGWGIGVLGVGGNVPSTDTSSPSATEVYEDGQNDVTTGNRSLMVSYASITAGNTFTPSGTLGSSPTTIRASFLIREAPAIGTLNAEQLADSPASLWSFEETVGTTAVDGPGTADGTYVSSPTLNQPGVPGSPGRSVKHVAASSDDTTLPVGAAANNAFSFSICFKMDAPLVTACLRDNSASGGSPFLLAGAVFLSCRIAGITLALPILMESLNDGKWHHFGVTRNAGASGKVYFDGTQVAAGGGSAIVNNPFHIAKNGTAAGFEDISADEVAFYTTELAALRMAVHAEAALNDYTISSGTPKLVVVS